ncbi:hypothetical protein QN277_000019 [Acacia crassicarpa]|uniref:Uncharacterized protein n=1 Tax=Acacia crassicarpa TaxID=499986 RepID=A0AAE1N5J4_9FABA|nr:hypothetical protein QN277_000019 [Acacia crassicarpa]
MIDVGNKNSIGLILLFCRRKYFICHRLRNIVRKIFCKGKEMHKPLDLALLFVGKEMSVSILLRNPVVSPCSSHSKYNLCNYSYSSYTHRRALMISTQEEITQRCFPWTH